MLNNRIIQFFVICAFFFLANIGSVSAASNYKCRCYKAIGDVTYTSEIVLENADQCNQHCSNTPTNKAFSFDFKANQPTTKAPGAAVSAAHTCSCNAGSVYTSAINNSITTSEAACIATCRSGGSTLYSYDNTLPFKSVPAAASTPGNGAIADNKIPGASVDDSSGLVKCGRPGGKMCTLCDLIQGMNDIIQYLMKLAIGVALLAITIGGVMYVVSAGNSGMTEMGKNAMKNAAVGFVIIFSAYLLINTTMMYLGTKKNAAGEATFGMAITSWGRFECTAKTR